MKGLKRETKGGKDGKYSKRRGGDRERAARLGSTVNTGAEIEKGLRG